MDKITNNLLQEETPQGPEIQTRIPSPAKTIKIFFVIFICSIFIDLIIYGFGRILGAPKAFSNISELLSTAIALFLFLRWLNKSNYNLENSLRLNSIPKNIIFPIILLAIGISCINGTGSLLMRHLLNYLLKTNLQYHGHVAPNEWWALIPFYIMGTIFAPITEDLYARGLIMTSFEASYGKWIAIIISSVIFGLLHVYPAQVIAVALGALIAGWLVYYTNSILSGILLHFIVNSGVFALRSLGDIFNGKTREVSNSEGIIIFIASIIVISMGIFWLKRNLDLSSQRPITFISDYFRRKYESKQMPSPSPEIIEQ